MQLEQRDKELAAIGASVGCNCRPCVEYPIAAGREVGLSEDELCDGVATARAIRDEAIELLAPRIDELLSGGGVPTAPASAAVSSREDALAALGASIGANSHPLLRRHIAAAFELGFTPAEVAAAVRMAKHVQWRAGEMTAAAASQALDELEGGSGDAARVRRSAPTQLSNA
jgi:AhpD family alkylhydroperoxidase